MGLSYTIGCPLPGNVTDRCEFHLSLAALVIPGGYVVGNFWPTFPSSRSRTETAGLLQEGREEVPHDLGPGGVSGLPSGGHTWAE